MWYPVTVLWTEYQVEEDKYILNYKLFLRLSESISSIGKLYFHSVWTMHMEMASYLTVLFPPALISF